MGQPQCLMTFDLTRPVPNEKVSSCCEFQVQANEHLLNGTFLTITFSPIIVICYRFETFIRYISSHLRLWGRYLLYNSSTDQWQSVKRLDNRKQQTNSGPVELPLKQHFDKGVLLRLIFFEWFGHIHTKYSIPWRESAFLHK